MQANKLPMSAGWRWVLDGAALFRRNPIGLWPVVAGYWLTLGVASAVPLLGLILAAMLIPPLSVGAMTACRELAAGRGATLLTLFVAFRPAASDYRPLQRLFALGAIHFLLTLAILGIASLFDGGTLFGIVTGKIAFSEAVQQPGVQAAANIAAVLSAPLTMAFWFAPVLVAWHELSIGKALFFSLVACWRNWKAFLSYGIALVLAVLVVAMLLGQLALALGTPQAIGPLLTMVFLLVLAPVLFATFYISYRDVFAAPAPIDESA